MAEKPIRLTISQAASLFGVSEKTIRRAIQEEEVTYIVVRGSYRINFESLLKWSQSKTKISNKFNTLGLGQYVDKWKIKNKLYSPNPKTAEKMAPKKAKKEPEEVENKQKDVKLEEKEGFDFKL